jgi:hypothetical protein
MSSSGWIIFALSIGTMTGLFLWCIVKVLRAEKSRAKESPQSPD